MAINGYSIPNVDLDLELGPLFIGHCFNWALYGLLCLQVYIFYASFPREVTRTKALVYSLLFIDTVSMAFSTYSGYIVFVSNWGNVPVFHQLGWSWATVPASSGLVAFIVQTFFAHRIWKISKNWWMPLFIVILSGLSCGFAFGAAVTVGHQQTFKYIRELTPSIWLGFGISADFFVCITLVYYLLRSPTRFTLTDRIIVRLVRITIETALVTIVTAAVKLYLIFSRKDNMHLLLCLLLSRLYSNAVLGTLNSRSSLFGGSQAPGSRRTSTARVWSSGPSSSFGSVKKEGSLRLGAAKKFEGGKIVVTCETTSDFDGKLEDEESQVITYEPVVPTYPLSPMAPSYRTQAAGTPTTEGTSTDPTLPSPPPSAKAFLS